MGRDNGADGWCILRCSAARTLLVATSLAGAGVDVWTPAEVQQRRRGRARERVECEIAIMPTFVFARAAELAGLFAILASPRNPHPAFSIFRFHGRIPIVSERDMSALRRVEEKARTRRLRTERKVIPVGTNVRMNEGGFAGMSGVVEESDGKFALVAFGGSFRVKIATFLFGTDAVHHAQAREGVAA